MSPGDLSEPHAFLEGLENCKQCHGSDRKEIAKNCLSCHTFIKSQLEQKNGLHGRQDYAECELCHVEHHGREFELIYWPDGLKAFNHSETGYDLTGEHKSLECRKCHREEMIVDRKQLSEAKRDMSRTYLGLSRDCESCHFDEHRAQLDSACQNCHTTDGWKPASGFDHSTAEFGLTGKHTEVKCEKCHRPILDVATSADTLYTHYTGLQFGECSACHKDIHQGRLGPNCSGCHTTSGWRTVNNASFDHDKTRYPLRGKHRALACEKCHRGGETRARLAFGQCTDCHADFHEGDFTNHESQGKCELCHGVEGFRPARFTIAQHDSSDFPLLGAHLAVPCDACHFDDNAGTRKAAYSFSFATHNCRSCHKDPHEGKTNQWMTGGDCRGCHTQSSWRAIDFDHSRTDFSLNGKHLSVACRECHWNPEGDWRVEKLQFKLKQQLCQDCHKDIHQGQFVTAEVTRCEQCHSPEGWKALKFDHNSQSRFKLQGAHVKVPCNGCHKRESAGEVEIIRYKPLGMACVDCHDSNISIDSL